MVAQSEQVFELFEMWCIDNLLCNKHRLPYGQFILSYGTVTAFAPYFMDMFRNHWNNSCLDLSTVFDGCLVTCNKECWHYLNGCC